MAHRVAHELAHGPGPRFCPHPLQALAIKREVKVAMRYKNFKADPKMLQKIVLFYKIFLSRYLFLWGHELASSFLLFRLHKFFLQMIINFSKRHKLHLLLTLDIDR